MRKTETSRVERKREEISAQIEEGYKELGRVPKNIKKNGSQELKKRDITIALHYAERTRQYLNRINDKMQSATRVETEEEIKEKLFNRYGLERDIFDKLERMKDDAEAGYTEMGYLLIILNSIIRDKDFGSDEFLTTVSRYLRLTKSKERFYLVDEETMCKILNLKEDDKAIDITIENILIDNETELSKSIQRIKFQDKMRMMRIDIDKYLKNNSKFLLDIYSNSAVKWGNYYLDEERNYCYKDGKFYLNQEDELKELEYSEL